MLLKKLILVVMILVLAALPGWDLVHAQGDTQACLTLENLDYSVVPIAANAPAALSGAVNLVLVGNTTVEDAVPPDTAIAPAEPIPVTTLVAANIRQNPHLEAPVVASAPVGTTLWADAISPDGWLRVAYGDIPGWVNRYVVAAADAIDELPIFTRDSRTPMQHFAFRTDRVWCEGSLPAQLVL